MKKWKVYLDNCCFNRPYDDQTQDLIMLETTAKLMIQKLILDRKVDLVWSYILRYENSKNTHISKRTAIAFWKSQSVEFVTHQEKIELIAEDIANTGVKANDSLHIACAIYANCDCFVTVDKRILRYKSEAITICNPMQFMSIYGGDES